MEQIGSIAVIPNLYLPLIENPTYGSGGGDLGDGYQASYGGGRIIFNSSLTISVSTTGIVTAEGSDAPSKLIGAGSGGSIVMIARNLVSSGFISVQGGSALKNSGAAGGGGRVVIQIASTQALSSTLLGSFKLDGGMVYGSQSQSTYCALGGAGTLYVEYAAYPYPKQASIFSYNSRSSNFPSLAATVVTDIPASTRSLSLYNYVKLYTQSLVFPREVGCDGDYAVCSSIAAANSSIECTALTATQRMPCMMQADVISLVESALIVSNVTNSTVSCRSLLQSKNSVMSTFSPLRINASDIVSMHGALLQYDYNDFFLDENNNKENISVSIIAEQNVTLHQVRVNALFVKTKVFTLAKNGTIQPAFGSMSDCVFAIPANHSACNNAPIIETLPYVINIQASRTLTVLSTSHVVSPAIFFCSPRMVINGSSMISSDGMGCPSNTGLGAGQYAVSSGGGGAGYGGQGGNGFGIYNNGGTYGLNNNNISSGSGGGCLFNGTTCTTNGGYGGGIIDLRASRSIYLHGNISSNGQSGSSEGSGAGSGGSISIVVGTSIQGKGSISANGGAGGNGATPGGGGGGGVLLLNTLASKTKTFKFGGSILATGGPAGYTTSSSSSSQSHFSSTLRRLDNSIAASSGQVGLVVLPSCPPGYGNDADIGDICKECAVGYYSYGGDGSCLACINKPGHAYYLDVGVQTSVCPYNCDNGYSDLQCYNQFQKFLYNEIGLGGFIGACVGFFTILIIPLLYYRYKKIYGWDEKDGNKYIEDSFNTANDDAAYYGNAEFGLQKKRTKTTDREMVSGYANSNNFSENPLAKQLQQEAAMTQDDPRWMQIRSLHSNRRGRDRRREYRLMDHDMVFHAFRLNFNGCNEPFDNRGGAWCLPTKRPNCLKPTLRKAEYHKFVEEVNALLAWSTFSFDMMLYYLTLLITPPFAAYVMRKLRHRRTEMLLDFIAKYDYSCFRCPVQRKAKNSLRVGISPDSTLAYIDILYDEYRFRRDCRPLCPLGQTKLPAAFKFAGLGTYSTPYFVDTNDLILQAVSQTDVAHAFIDETWITFVYNLNTLLRTVQCDAVYAGILKVMKFLNDGNNVKDLGGMIVQLATFDNQIDIDDHDAELPASKKVVSNAFDARAGLEVSSQEQPIINDMRNRDTFINMGNRPSRFTQQQDDGDATNNQSTWLTKIGDALHLTRQDQQNCEKGGNDMIQRETGYELSASETSSSRHLNSSSHSNLRPNVTLSSDTHGGIISDNRSSTDESMKEQTQSSSWSIFTWLSHWIQSFNSKRSTNKKKKQQSQEPLDFIATCEAIRRGELTLGIVVSHPKVVSDLYVVKDEDYDSETDELDIDNEQIQVEDDGNDEEDDGDKQRICNPNRSNEEEEEEVFVREDSSATDLTATTVGGTATAIHRGYGSKAEDMAKFYRIMHKAETGVNDQQSVDAAAAAAASAFSPVLVSSIPPVVAAQGSLSPARSSKDRESTTEDERKEGEVSNNRPKSARITTGMDSLSSYTEFNSSRRHGSSTHDPDNNGARDSEFDDSNHGVRSSPSSRRSTGLVSEEIRDSGAVDSPSNQSIISVSPPSNKRVSMNVTSSPSLLSSPSPASRQQFTLQQSQSGSRDNLVYVDDEAVANRAKKVDLAATLAAKRRAARKRQQVARKKLINRAGLAPSCFQQPLRVWRLSSSILQGAISDGLLGPQEDWVQSWERKQGLLPMLGGTADIEEAVSSPLAMAPAPAISTATASSIRPKQFLDLEALRDSVDEVGGTYNSKPAAHNQQLRDARRSSVGEYGHHDDGDGDRGTNAGGMFFYRESGLPMSFFGQIGGAATDKERDVTTSKVDLQHSTAMMSPVAAMVDTAGAINEVGNRDSEAPQMPGTGETRTLSTGAANWFFSNRVVAWLRPRLRLAYINNFYVYYFVRFMIGSNVQAFGPNYIRRLIEFLIFMLCVSDVILWSLIFVTSQCVSNNTTQCSNHNALYLIIRSVLKLSFLFFNLTDLSLAF